ncbi:hypothetical protein EAF04_006411 [Stromatinia cepivora]|nr:hypothetical protein EAF04_006411 [Stromatinia cepivora]
MEDRTFHPFPRLPKETRLVIWKLALPGPRIVLMRLGRLENEPGLCTRVLSNKPNDTEGNAKFFDWTEWPNPYIQLLDTLHFECGPLQFCRRAYSPCKIPGLLLACPDIARVENLAIRWHRYDYEDDFHRQCSSSLNLLIYPANSDRIFKIIAPFSALKKLTFVSAYHDDTEMYDLVWMDIFYVALQLEYYEEPYNPGNRLRIEDWIRNNNKSLDPPTIAVKIGPQKMPPFFTTGHVHQHEGYKNVQPKYKIERKIITTSQFQERLNRFKARHVEEQRNSPCRFALSTHASEILLLIFRAPQRLDI